MRFTYQTGAQPLAGYTIQRGIHRGGFGEVYFAHSGGGKEVALKLLHEQDQDVEIRGVTQCLNLKHPNLVNIFDLTTDQHGDHWVVMEYVAGSSLEDILGSFPDGLPLTEVRDWLTGLVAGVSHLHDRGIVHRDLKPANVYRENGVVKVGDVGLSKRIDSDRRNANTQSVGTVYYMAPEVARGQYGPEVDVYSLGVMLYEMITGQLPFTGETTGEILMKHLTAQPDLTPIPKSLRPMLARALEKDPRKRTPSVRQLEQDFLRTQGASSPAETIPESAFLPPLPPKSNRYFDTHGAPPNHSYTRPSFSNTPVPPTNSGSQWIAREMASQRNWLKFEVLAFLSLFFFQYGTTTSVGLGIAILATAFWNAINSYELDFKDKNSNDKNRPDERIPPNPGRKSRPFATFRTACGSPAVELDRPWSERLPELCRSMGLSAGIAALISATIYFSLAGLERGSVMPSSEHAILFASTSIVGSWLLLIGHAGTISSKWTIRQRWLARLVVGIMLGSCAYGLSQFLLVNLPPTAFTARSAISSLGTHPLAETGGNPTWLGFVCFFAGWLGIRRWSRDMDLHRKRRFSIWLMAAAVTLAYAVSVVLRFPQVYAMLWAGTISTTVQIAANWQPRSRSWGRR